MRHAITTLAACAAAAVLVGGVAASDAHAFGKTAKFRMEVRGSQRSIWIEPRHMTYYDCYHRYWVSGQGHETIHFRSRRPVKLLAYTPATLVFVRYGTYSKTDERSLGGVPVQSHVERRGHWAGGSDPGDCGGPTRSEIDKGRDCGGVNHDWEASFDLSRRRRVALQLHDRTVSPLVRSDYEDCPLVVANDVGVPIAQNQLTPIETALENRDLFDPRKKRIVLRARRTFRQSERKEWGGVLNMETQVEWQVTLVRVK